MYYEKPSEERRKEIIEKSASLIVDNNLGSFGILFLDNFKTLAYLGSQFSMALLSPFLMLLGSHEKTGFEVIRMFERKENIEALVQKIEELKKEGEIAKLKETELSENIEKKGVKYYIKRIWKLIV